MEEENKNNQEKEAENTVVFDYSIDSEVNRVNKTLARYGWYKEQGYKPKFPVAIQEKLDKGEEVTENEVERAVADEFDQDIYAEKLAKVEEEWSQIQENFFENLKTLGLPLQSEYKVTATKYGTGGSYHTPNIVQLNFEQKSRGALTLAHEIVHLTIQSLIKEYNIEHWTKERLVDLIMNKFFPDNQRLQRDSENAEKISEIFENGFPNIGKVIGEIASNK